MGTGTGAGAGDGAGETGLSIGCCAHHWFESVGANANPLPLDLETGGLSLHSPYMGFSVFAPVITKLGQVMQYISAIGSRKECAGNIVHIPRTS